MTPAQTFSLTFLLGSAFASFLLAVPAHGSPDGPRPNIVLFLVDDMGWMDCSAYGSAYYETPNIERLARRGMLFTDAYAMPLCSPTRASILTGQHSSRHRVTSASGHLPPGAADASPYPASAPPNRPWIYAASQNYLDPSQTTLAEALRDAGYRTGHLGKWHLGLTEPHWPEQQGFEVAVHGKPDPGPNSYFSPYGFRQFQSFPDGPDGEYITDRLTDEALRFLAAQDDRPFLLHLWHYGVHGPWGHKEEYTRQFAAQEDPREMQGNPIMASMLKSIDESLGSLLDKLEELALADHTIVIFYSDNGGNTHSNTPEDRKTADLKPGHPRYGMIEDWRRWAGGRPPTNNAPLRDGKGRLYEGGIRVPLIVAWPGRVPPGSRSGEVVGCIDLYPTILEMAGVPMPESQTVDGLSFVPVLTQQGRLERHAFFTWFPHLVPGVSVRQGDWKLIRRFEPTDEYPDGHELFNLRQDLGETKNLAAGMASKVRELNALIDGFLAQTGARLPRPNPAYKPGSATGGRPLRGWVPKSCQAEIRDGALQVTAAGRTPFLAMTGLRLSGPVTLTARVRTSAAGAGRVQWRTADQETFVDSQVAGFELAASGDWQEVAVPLPVRGQLLHLRLYLPATSLPARIAALRIAADAADGAARSWDFSQGE